MATMLAGVYDGLVVTPQHADRFRLPLGAGKPSCQGGVDLRTLNWKKDIEAYRWALSSIGDKLSRQAVAYEDPTKHLNRDYLVEFKIPVVWICHEKAGRKLSRLYRAAFGVK